MDGYIREHPPTGYGLGRHAPMPQPPAQSAQQLAEGSTGATTATPDASAPTTPRARAQSLLSQRTSAAPPPAARPAPAPSLAAPPPPAPAPASPLAAPPPAAPAPSPVAAPAPTPNQWGIDFSTSIRPPGWSDTMESIANPNAPDRAGNRAWLADPRSNPNNVMGNFIDPTTKRGYSDFLNPSLQVSPGGIPVAPGTPGFMDPNPNPQAYAQPISRPPQFQSADADQALADYQARPQPPIVDTIPPPDQLPPSAADDSARTAQAIAAASSAPKGFGAETAKPTGTTKATYFTGGRR